MSIAYLDPTAEPQGGERPYALEAAVRRPGLRVGLIANSFPGATAFMQCMERELAAALPQAAFEHFQKPSVTRITDEVAAAMEERCDVAVAAWGH